MIDLPSSKLSPGRAAGAFTFVELMASMGILTLLLLVLLSMTDATQRMWAHTSSNIEQFRNVREALESLSRKLSQATLNTYLDYHYDTNGIPDRYVRQSELRFISGNAEDLTGSSLCPTQAVFFQAPLGYVTDANYANLDQLLNTWGYFVEYGDDSGLRPEFINGLSGVVPVRHRFRLKELCEPSNGLTLYKETSGKPDYTGREWFKIPFNLSGDARPARVVAENIIALVLRPMLSPSQQEALNNGTPPPALPYSDASLAPNYLYDSTGTGMGANLSDANLNPKHQLPPIVQVTMVGVDEPSFIRLNPGATAPILYPPALFKNSASYKDDIETMEAELRKPDRKLTYRVFTTNVKLRAARWSRAQQN